MSVCLEWTFNMENLVKRPWLLSLTVTVLALVMASGVLAENPERERENPQRECNCARCGCDKGGRPKDAKLERCERCGLERRAPRTWCDKDSGADRSTNESCKGGRGERRDKSDKK